MFINSSHPRDHRHHVDHEMVRDGGDDGDNGDGDGGDDADGDEDR